MASLSVFVLLFPTIDPVALSLGPLTIRWYALAYVAGILVGWWLLRRLNLRPIDGLPPRPLSKQAIDDIMVWAIAGILLGGRLGYVLFYKPGYYLEFPAEIFKVWHGGMSFHGGFIGVLVAMYLFCRKFDISCLILMDMLAAVAPVGLFFGRIANFINGELYGRVAASDVSWAMVFPGGGDLPRHPSQLYEATMEGLLLFILLFGLAWYSRIREKPGMLSGLFLIGYGIARSTAELFREPDAHLGFLLGGSATMGQLLSLPMIAAGMAIMLWAWRRPRVSV